MLSIAVAATATALAAPATTPVWRDPAVNQVNREARRADFFAFENVDKAKVGDNSEVTASSGNGTTFAPITNGDLPPFTDDYEVNMWPEDMNADRSPAAAYVSDFKFKTAGPTLSGMIENANQIYVALAPGYSAETGVGFYAFAIIDAAEGNNGDYELVIKLYKAP